MKKLIKFELKISNWLSKHLGGHLDIGPVTFFGFNAMHGAIQFHVKKYGYITISPPLRHNGGWWPAHIFISPDATPCSATFVFGECNLCRSEKVAATWRRIVLGHNYSTEKFNSCDVRDIFDAIEYLLRKGIALKDIRDTLWMVVRSFEDKFDDSSDGLM
jgi:hypothetical protein